jgi:hypothetical protein
MSVNLSRRDAIKGAMVASAALAAAPYLGNLVGGVQAGPIQTAPAQPTATQAVAAGSASLSGAASDNSQPLVLIIRNDIVQSFKGLQEITVQDAGLAQKLRSAFIARYD